MTLSILFVLMDVDYFEDKDSNAIMPTKNSYTYKVKDSAASYDFIIINILYREEK